MASTPPSTTVQPLEFAKETILGMTRALEQRFGCVPRNDLATTLNNKYGVMSSQLPQTDPKVNYFCWGVGGRLNDTDGLTSAQYVLGTNMSLYKPRPFRAVPLEEDLSLTEMANYAMRQVTPIGGVPYCLYWLKKIAQPQSQVSYIRTDPVSGTSATYELDYSNLTNPTPPTADSNGVLTDVADQVSVTLPGVLTITGQEVIESASVMDAGDLRYAVVSELGLVSAAAQSVQATDAIGHSFTYQEAIMAQLVEQYNWIGQPFISTTDTWTRSMAFSCRNLINQA